MSSRKSIAPRTSLVPFTTIDWSDLSPVDLDITEELEATTELPDVTGFLSPVEI